MKRLSVPLAAALAASTTLATERQEPECKDRNCASEVIAKVPEQHHAPEEVPAYEELGEWVVIPSSPAAHERRCSEYYREWVEKYGTDGIEPAAPPASWNGNSAVL